MHMQNKGSISRQPSAFVVSSNPRVRPRPPPPPVFASYVFVFGCVLCWVLHLGAGGGGTIGAAQKRTDQLIDESLLSEPERQWLNDYHTSVRETLGPLLKGHDEEAYEYLVRETRPLGQE